MINTPATAEARSGRAELMPKLIDLVGRLHRAGVPLLAASDLDWIPGGRAPRLALRAKCNCSKQRDCQRPRPAKPPALPPSNGGSGNAEHAPQLGGLETSAPRRWRRATVAPMPSGPTELFA